MYRTDDAMLSIRNLHFDIPGETCDQVAAKVDKALDDMKHKNEFLRMIFTVTPSKDLMNGRTLRELKDAAEPYRCRVRYACVENVVVVKNPATRVLARAALLFLKPDVPTRVVSKYYARDN